MAGDEGCDRVALVDDDEDGGGGSMDVVTDEAEGLMEEKDDFDRPLLRVDVVLLLLVCCRNMGSMCGR